MKNVLILFLIIFITSCQPKELPTILEQRDGFAMMKISHETVKDELSEMITKLATQDIVVDVKGTEFFENGHVKKLILTVIAPDGSKGVTKADIVALQFRYFGFMYNKEGNPSFKIGEI